MVGTWVGRIQLRHLFFGGAFTGGGIEYAGRPASSDKTLGGARVTCRFMEVVVTNPKILPQDETRVSRVVLQVVLGSTQRVMMMGRNRVIVRLGLKVHQDAPHDSQCFRPHSLPLGALLDLPGVPSVPSSTACFRYAEDMAPGAVQTARFLGVRFEELPIA